MPWRSGWPSASRGILADCCAETRAHNPVASAIAMTVCFMALFRERLLAPLAVEQFLDELDPFEVHQLRVLVATTVERHADLRRLGEHLRIFDRGLVVDNVPRHPRVRLPDVDRL